MNIEARLREHIGTRLKSIRRRRSLSITILAKKASVDRRTIQFCENGEREMYVSTLIKLADALEVSVGDFVDDFSTNSSTETVQLFAA